MKLVIVESPSKAKTISKYLGKGFEVRASVGHVRDLPKSNKDAVDIEHGFKPKYINLPKKKEVISELKSLAKNADEIILATDPDREGEAIAWHISQALGLDKQQTTNNKPLKVSRIAFHEITEEAIKEALDHPRDIDENLLKAQEARRVLDRLVGYDLSGLIWKKVRYGLSAGRVQSPALRILVEREREIKAFIPESYWVITALLSKQNETETTEFTCVHEPSDEEETNALVADAKASDWLIESVEEKEAKRSPYAPFKTSTLQQAASSRLGFSPKRTMGVAQKLYEAGLITYMRTDSLNLSEAALKEIHSVVGQKFGTEHLQPRRYATKSKNAQEAHEAIRPTNVRNETAGANDEQKRLYNLIWTRAVSSQMKDARIMRTKVTARASRVEHPFTVTGSRVLYPGWLMLDTKSRGEDVELPPYSANERVDLKDIASEGKETTPPSRYTEAGLIKELEKRDIGRPSTYASIISTLVERGYVDKENRSLKPTDTGEVVSTFLEENFTDYISDSFTAEMEEELDEIARGEREYEKTLKEFYGPFTKDVKEKSKSAAKITDLGPAPDEWRCPVCDAAMIIKLGRAGKFMSCSRFPDCTGARTMEGVVVGDEEPIGIDPESKEPVFVLEGPYGPYVQLGEKNEKNKKPRRASLPKDETLETITLEGALKLLSLPRELGAHPESGKPVVANIGRFGPYIGHDGDFRSLKEDDPYTITFERALEILAEPKKTRRGRFAAKKTPKKSSRKKAAKKASKKKEK